jgi:hypothetical protein
MDVWAEGRGRNLKTIRAHRIELDLTKKQVQYFLGACGTARFVRNWIVAGYREGRKIGEGYTPVGDLKKETSMPQRTLNIKYRRFFGNLGPWTIQSPVLLGRMG